jgi:hypothetical protein
MLADRLKSYLTWGDTVWELGYGPEESVLSGLVESQAVPDLSRDRTQPDLAVQM